MSSKFNTTVLIAPLDWGLGHAARCIPVITHLLELGCNVIIATEGMQEKLLKNEFPALRFVHLPGYRIHYSSKKRFFSSIIALQLPKIFRAVRDEKKWLQKFITNNKVDCVISDNRYGLHHSGVPSVFITHQLVIKAPFAFAETIMRRINYSFIKKFSACWVPDEKANVNMAGTLSHPVKLPQLPVEYLGGLSRFQKREGHQKKYDVLIVLSGPEPQRTLLEKKVLQQLEHFEGKAFLIRGLPGTSEKISLPGKAEIENHLPAGELESKFLESEYIISRSGYTTVMDICKLHKKSVLIPTPGQTEQEYLAGHLQKQGWCVAVNQENFVLKEALLQAQHFNYQLPVLNMEAYKGIVESFINNLHTQ